MVITKIDYGMYICILNIAYYTCTHKEDFLGGQFCISVHVNVIGQVLAICLGKGWGEGGGGSCVRYIIRS